MVARWLRALALAVLPAGALADAPVRVLSMNVCTDQLAMMVAAPGQLISVSWLARDPRMSAMTDQAAAYPTNRGLAEDIVLRRPDLVLVSQFSASGTVAMLKRLGIPVAVFPAETDLQGIRDNLHLMGRVLGREAQAQAVAARFDADLAALANDTAPARRAAIYEASGYSAGRDSLSGAILHAAGLSNVAAELGLTHGGFLPLERLALAHPDLVVTSTPYQGASRAEELLDHPVLRALTADRAAVQDADWVCGTPHVVRAIARLRAP